MFTKYTKFLGRISFFQPESTDVVIFSETNAPLVKNIIPDNLTSSVFSLNPIEINVTPKIICGLFANLRYFEFDFRVISKRGVLYLIFWQLHMIYIKSDLDSRKTKALITYIDNSSKFAWLSKNFEAPCIAIQNGFRLAYAADSLTKYYCQHFFCFGQQQVVEYPKLGYRVDHFYPVGSLNLSNNYDEKINVSQSIFDFLIISCWRGNIGFGEEVRDSMNGMRVMDELFAKYLNKRDLTAAVILRSERGSDDWFMPEIGLSEEEYYQSIYGDSLKIIDVNFAQKNVYQVMQMSDVIIAGFPSTCILEAFSIGHKVLYANFCGTDKYHLDFSPKIVFKGDTDDALAFEARLDSLHKIEASAYKKHHLDLMNYYIRSPSTLSVADQIRNQISIILKWK